MPEPTPLGDSRPEQVIRDCLTALYSRDYYSLRVDAAGKSNSKVDFGIFLSSGLTGGSGLAILKDPRFSLLCGLLTVISLALNGLKRHFRLQEKLTFFSERLQFFEDHYADLKMLVDDMNEQRKWTKPLSDRYDRIRSKKGLTRADPYPELSVESRREIQNAIKQRINYTTWWRP